jgi:hypothetical protein
MSSREAVTSDPVIRLAELWSGYFVLAYTQCKAIIAGLESFCDPRIQRRRWLQALTEAVDCQQPSTAYADLLWSTLQTMTAITVLQDQLFREFVYKVSLPLAREGHELPDRRQDTEVMLETRLKAIEDRLTTIQVRLDASLSPG